MSRRTNVLLALAVSLSVAPACDEVAEGEFGAGDDIAFRPSGWGGLQLNTNAIGDHPLNEINTKGELHDGTVLKAVFIKTFYKEQMQYAALDEVWAEQGEIRGRIGTTTFKGPQFVGSRWYIDTFSGGLVSRMMTVQSYRFDWSDKLHKYVFAYPFDPAYGLHYYDKEAQPIKDTKLVAACAGGSIEAVVSENLRVDMKTAEVKIDDHLINIGCEEGGIGKAQLWGYPWYKVGELTYQTALRMVRADYLGDGDSWTKSGTAIDLEDTLGINSFFDPSLALEAVWTPSGAACIEKPRRPEFSTADVVAEGIEPCKGRTIADFPNAMMSTLVP